MKKRWFVVILTIGLLLRVLPLSVLALSPDPTITDSDGTILDWSDLSTVPYSLDDSQEQNSAVVDAKSGTDAETGSGKSLADVDHDDPADDTDGTGGTGDTGSTGSTGSTGGTGGTTPPEKSPADAGSDKAATDDLPAGNPTPPPSLLTRNWRAMPLRTTPAAPQPRLCARSTRSTIRTTTPHWTRRSARRCLATRSTC